MKDAEAAKAEIQKKVDELEAMTEITVEIDSRIHPRIIGGRGRNVKQIMTDFKVRRKLVFHGVHCANEAEDYLAMSIVRR